VRREEGDELGELGFDVGWGWVTCSPSKRSWQGSATGIRLPVEASLREEQRRTAKVGAGSVVLSSDSRVRLIGELLEKDQHLGRLVERTRNREDDLLPGRAREQERTDPVEVGLDRIRRVPIRV
jgi:hypothetical protein